MAIIMIIIITIIIIIIMPWYLRISKVKMYCPEWLRSGLGNCERVGEAHCVETLNRPLIRVNVIARTLQGGGALCSQCE